MVNTSGTKMPRDDEAELIRDGNQIEQLESDLTALDVRAIADAFYEAVAKVLSAG